MPTLNLLNRAGAWASIALLLPGIAFSQGRASSPERARDLLESSLKDKNPETRTHAVESLGLASATEPWLSELAAMIDDKDVEVRLSAIASLVDLKPIGRFPLCERRSTAPCPKSVLPPPTHCGRSTRHRDASCSPFLVERRKAPPASSRRRNETRSGC